MTVRAIWFLPSSALLASCAAAVGAPNARPMPAPAGIVAEPLAQRPIDADADFVPLSADQIETYPDARGMPADVQRFIVKWSDCAHWLGEPPWNAERQRQIDAAVADVCLGVDALGTEVRQRHAGNAAVIARIERYDALDQ